MVEFAFAGVPVLLILMSIIQISLAMWNYESLAFAIREGTRYIVTKGQGCTYTGNTCSITIGNVAQQIITTGIGLIPQQMNVTFTSSDGTTVTCSPVSSCLSNSTAWPPSSANTRNSSTVTIAASYPMKIWFMNLLSPVNITSLNMAASSQQVMQF